MMKIRCVPMVLCVLMSVPAWAQMDMGSLKGLAGKGAGVDLTSDQASGGLKEALAFRPIVEKAMAKTGVT